MTARLKSLRQFSDWLGTAMKMKARMQEKSLRAARAKCPHCDGGIISATLNGDHIHARCSTVNCLQVME